MCIKFIDKLRRAFSQYFACYSVLRLLRRKYRCKGRQKGEKGNENADAYLSKFITFLFFA
jgi:hypothetical protein